MSTLAHCISIVIGKKVEYKFLTEEFLVKNVCISTDVSCMILGTLRYQDVAIGRRLLLRHLIITFCQKESLYFIPMQGMKTPTEICLAAVSKWTWVETEYDGLWLYKTIQIFPV